MSDLSMMSTADLQALQNGDMGKVSTEGLRILAGGAASAQQPVGDRVVTSAKPAVDSLGRQLGLTARYAIEGPAEAASVFTEPIRQYITDPLVKAFSPQTMSGMITGAKRESPSAGQLAHNFADWLGLPSPQGPMERVVGDATRTGFGAMTLGGAAKLLPSAAGLPQAGFGGKVSALVPSDNLIAPGVAGVANRVAALPQAVGEAFATKIPMQVTSAVGAGGGGGVARESGYGPVGQTIGAVVGGVAAPLSAEAVGNAATKVGNVGRSIYNFATSQSNVPTVDVKISNLLRSRGVDWDSLNGAVKNYLRENAGQYIINGQPLDGDALARLAHYQNVRGVTPSLGTVTQDPVILTQQANAAKLGANTGNRLLADMQNNNAKGLLSAVDDIAGGPLGVYDPRAAADKTIGSLLSQNAALEGKSDALYGTARDQIGRTAPLDRSSYVSAIYKNLADQNRTAFLPDSVGKLIDQISKGVDQFGNRVPFNPDVIDNLKTIIAQEQRATANGNVKAALGAVRNALDNTAPRLESVGTGTSMVTPAQAASLGRAQSVTEDAMAAWDAARQSEAARHAWIKANPPVADAVNGMEPGAWIKRYITNATPEAADSLNALLKDQPSRDAVRSQLAAYLKSKLSGGEGENALAKTNPAQFRGAMNDLQDVLPKWFSKEEVQRLRSIERVAVYEKNQPTGSAINNSNTGGTILGTAANWLDSIASKLPMGKQIVSDPMRNIRVSLGNRTALNPVPGLLNPEASVPTFQRLAAPMAIGGLLASPVINQP